MSERIRLLKDEEASTETRNLFEAVTAMLGRVPNSYKVLARVPLVGKMLIPFNAVMQLAAFFTELVLKFD